MAEDDSRHGLPAPSTRSETLSDGTLVVWDGSRASGAWVHGTPVENRP